MKKLVFLLASAFSLTLMVAEGATFLPLNEPCTLEPTPAFESIAKTSDCPFCLNYDKTPLHLRWDLGNTGMADPVCYLQCATADHKLCNPDIFEKLNIVDIQGNAKNSFKPKDDAFINNPAWILNNMSLNPGAHYINELTLRCTDQKGSKSQASAPIRVVKDCSNGPTCGAGGRMVQGKSTESQVCACQERKFSDIIKDLDAYNFPVEITEKNASGWAQKDAADHCDNNACLGSGDIDNVNNKIYKLADEYTSGILKIIDDLKDKKGNLPAVSAVRRMKSDLAYAPDRIDEILKANGQNNAVPVIMVTEMKQTEKGGYIKIVPAIITGFEFSADNSTTTLNVQGMKVDCRREQFTDNLLFKVLMTITSIDRNYYNCSPGMMPIFFEEGGNNPISELVKNLKNNGFNNSSSNINNEVYQLKGAGIDFSKDENISVNVKYPKILFLPVKADDVYEIAFPKTLIGYQILELKLAYLGKFDPQGRDCHPDGSFSSSLKKQSLMAQVLSSINNLISSISDVK